MWTTPAPPVASFSTNPANPTGNAPLTISFTDTSTGGAVASRTWDFGDGTVVGPQTPATANHTYSVAGTFTVTVTVTDTGGLSSSATRQVTVNAPPDAPPSAALTVTPTG